MIATLLSAVIIFSSVADDRQGDDRRDRRLRVRIACHESFQYDHDRRRCIETTVGRASAVRACVARFDYDYKRFDCLKVARNGRSVNFCKDNMNFDYKVFECLRDMAQFRPGVYIACHELYQFDHQRRECRTSAVGNGRAVRACHQHFQWDYQRKECFQKAHSGEVVDYCVTTSSYFSEQMKCVEDLSRDGDGRRRRRP